MEPQEYTELRTQAFSFAALKVMSKDRLEEKLIEEIIKHVAAGCPRDTDALRAVVVKKVGVNQGSTFYELWDNVHDIINSLVYAKDPTEWRRIQGLCCLHKRYDLLELLHKTAAKLGVGKEGENVWERSF